MQDWTDLYLELAEVINEKVPAIRWIDLWHNQVNFLSEEHPFPSPAFFMSFRILTAEDLGEKKQKVTFQVDTYIFYETFADTYRGSVNQGTAVEFLKLISATFAELHGTSGENYSEMRRIGFDAVDTGGAGNLYRQSYIATLIDYSAAKKYVDTEVQGLEIEKGEAVAPPNNDDDDDMFIIPG